MGLRKKVTQGQILSDNYHQLIFITYYGIGTFKLQTNCHIQKIEHGTLSSPLFCFLSWANPNTDITLHNNSCTNAMLGEFTVFQFRFLFKKGTRNYAMLKYFCFGGTQNLSDDLYLVKNECTAVRLTKHSKWFAKYGHEL